MSTFAPFPDQDWWSFSRRKHMNVTQLTIGRKWNNAVSNARSYIWLLKIVSSESMEPLKMRDINLECFCLTAPVCCSTAVPNKIVSLQWAEEDKFGFSSSFHLFDAFITKGQKAGNGSRSSRFCLWNVLMLMWHFGLLFFFLTELRFLSAFWISCFLCKGNPVPMAKFSLECTERPACDC